MKNKLKKFYNDHKDLLICTASGIVIGASTVAAYAIRKAEGNELADIRLYRNTKTDDMFINVVRKNGSYQNFLWSDDREL